MKTKTKTKTKQQSKTIEYIIAVPQNWQMRNAFLSEIVRDHNLIGLGWVDEEQQIMAIGFKLGKYFAGQPREIQTFGAVILKESVK